jgi:WD40 repeat protein
VAYSPGGTTLAVGDDDGSTYLWSAASGRLLATLTDPGGQGPNAVAFSPAGTTLAVGDQDGSTYLWSVASGRLFATLSDAGDSSGQVEAVAFSPDSALLAVSDNSVGVTFLWNLSNLHPN